MWEELLERSSPHAPLKNFQWLNRYALQLLAKNRVNNAANPKRGHENKSPLRSFFKSPY